MMKNLSLKQKMLGISLIALFVFVLILLDVLFDGALVAFDQVLHSLSLAWLTPLWDKIFFAITQLGSLAAMLLYSLIVLLILFRQKAQQKMRFYLWGMLGSAAMFSGIKELICRSRPSSYIGDFHQHGYSFPSGHSSMSMTFALLLFFLLYSKVSEGYRRALIAFCLLFPLLIGFSRIYLGVHYFSDVMGGFTLAVFWVMLMAWRFESGKSANPSTTL